jgi:AbrB family looped-hinge helix DNA binding protein
MTSTKLVRLSKKGQLVLPKDMRAELDMKEGDELIIIKEDTYIMVTTPEHFAQATRGSMRGTWGRNTAEIDDYIKRERDGWS